jgi:uncharacterized membrane protein
MVTNTPPNSSGDELGTTGTLPPVSTEIHIGVQEGVPRWLIRVRGLLTRLGRSKLVQYRYADWIALAVGVGVFSAVVGWVWGLRYWAFQTNAWDLGIYFQGMYTTAVDHRLFYYTAELPAGTHGYLFSTHFSPFLFLLVPAFSLAPTPSGLLVLQAIGLGLGAIPTYFLARFKLNSGAWAALFAGIYLLSPLTVGTGWYDFHPEAFLPVTALTAFYFYERRQLYPFLAAFVLTLSVIETMAPFLILFGVVTLVGGLWWYRKEATAERRTQIWFGAWAVVLAVAWYALAAAVVLSINQSGGSFGAAYARSWSVLGAQSILDVFPRALTNPVAAGAALSYSAGGKLLYVVILLGSFAFLPIFGRLQYVLPGAAWLGLALLSNNVGYYVINDQYVAYVLPFLIPATITGILWLRRVHFRWKPVGRRGPLTAAVLVVALVSISAASSPFLAQPIGSFNAVPHGIPTLTAHDRLLHEVIGMIPAGAAVLTTSRIFPEVANRTDAYVSPVSSAFVQNLTFEGVVAQYVAESRYVLVDYEIDFKGAVILLDFANLTGFGLEAAAGGAYLYERGWTGAPALWVPYTYSIAGGYLSPELANVDHAVTTPLGPTLYHAPSDGVGAIWKGPVLEGIPPGQYRVEALVQLNASQPGPTAAFTVLNATVSLEETETTFGSIGHTYSFQLIANPTAPVAISNQSMSWNGTGPSDVLVGWTATVNWTGPGFIETRGWALSPGVGVRLYWVSIVQISAP